MARPFGNDAAMSENPFPWPEGKRVALSLSFDDARPSNVAYGLPILAEHRVRATFYVLMEAVRAQAAGWTRVVAAGHELGNHTRLHPCSGNFTWARHKALEDYSLERIEAELLQANEEIAAFCGRRPTTFAYCCGQKFVGRGRGVRSYVPVVAEHFRVGRGFRDEFVNDASYCDLAQVAGVDFDGMEASAMIAHLEQAASIGGWVVFAGHDIGAPARQCVTGAALDALCRYAADPRNGVWIDTVAAIGDHVARTRAAP
jgi:peptidoglycan-N-acetylglucosamine deacetylase